MRYSELMFCILDPPKEGGMMTAMMRKERHDPRSSVNQRNARGSKRSVEFLVKNVPFERSGQTPLHLFSFTATAGAPAAISQRKDQV